MKFLSDGVFAEMQAHSLSMRLFIEAQGEQIKYLTEQIIELKRDGFARPQPQMVQQHVAATAMHPSILAAIRAVAGEGTSLERELNDYATAALLAGDEAEDVADHILKGSPIGDDDGG